MRPTLLVLLLSLGGLPALAAPQPEMPPSTAPRPTSLEELARDLRSETTGRRGYAARELRRRARSTRRTLDKGKTHTLEYTEAKVSRADQLELVGPAAASCVQKWDGQRAACAAILGALGDARYADALRAARKDAGKRGQKAIDKALARIEEGP